MNADQIYEHYYGDPLHPTTQRCRQRIHWICKQVEGNRVLDIGCSQGVVCLLLGREGFDCTGVDIEAAAIKYARAALAKEEAPVRQHVQFQLADARKLPFEDNSFDTVVLGEILEHLTRPERVLKEVKRVLKDQGKLIVSVPYGLLAHQDHKRSFYPISLLETLGSYFRVTFIDALQVNQLVYTGVKDSSYKPAALPQDPVFSTYAKWEKQLEERCLACETSLQETNAKLGDQIKTLTSQVSMQAAQMKELQAELADKENKCREVTRAVKEAHTGTTQLRGQLAKKETELARARTKLTSTSELLISARHQIKVLEKEITRLRQELTANNTSWQKRMAALESVHATQLHEWAKQRDDSIAHHEAEVTGLRKELLASAKTNLQLQAHSSNLTATLGAAQQQVKALEAEILALRQQLTSNNAAWQKRLSEIERLNTARLQEREKQWQDNVARHEAECARLAANERMRDLVRAVLPPDAIVLVISKGDDDLLQLAGRTGWHFPQTTGGVYAGYHPADSAEAIAHLEILKAKGAEFLLIPAPSFWWLDYYSEFRQHLESNYHLVAFKAATCFIIALRAPPEDQKERLAISFAKATPVKAPAGAARQPAPPITNPALTDAKKTMEAPASAVVEEARPPAVSVVTPSTPPRKAPSNPLTVGAILDEFTTACFAPECSLVTFRPDNWKRVLERTPIDLLLVESAWHGNGGSWQYKIASFNKPMGDELLDVLSYCKIRQIPTVFWNKEDPPHFDRFIHRAPFFDAVMTSDAKLIPQYRRVVKHDLVFALPFAAQPKIHHPILEQDRLCNVCFAGAYYALDHDERRKDMDLLLRPALPFGLHIYDRQHGLAGVNAKLYQFPEIYRSAIRGRLEYEAMVRAYKQYRVFLNVNSVKHSPTMFSRRVFELLASGTPVISAPSQGILELFGNDLVQITQSEEETTAHLERLLQNESFWAQISLRGIREVFSRHTYAHRLAVICQSLSLPAREPRLPSIQVVARVSTDRDIKSLAQILVRQTYRRFNLTVLAAKKFTARKFDPLIEALPGIQVQLEPPSRQLLEVLSQAADGDYLWLVNLEDYYGDNFLLDVMLSTVYSTVEVIGKQTHFEAEGRPKKLRLKEPDHEFRPASDFSPGSVIAKTGSLTVEQWKALAANHRLVLSNQRGLSIDRFNYVRRGGTWAQSRGQEARHALAQVLV